MPSLSVQSALLLFISGLSVAFYWKFHQKYATLTRDFHGTISSTSAAANNACNIVFDGREENFTDAQNLLWFIHVIFHLKLGLFINCVGI